MQVPNCIDDDPAKPCGEFRLAAEAVDLLDQGTAHVLRDILGVGARSGELPGKAMNAIVVAVHQRGERVAIARHCGND